MTLSVPILSPLPLGRPLRLQFGRGTLALILLLVSGVRPLTAAIETNASGSSIRNGVPTQIRTALDRMSTLMQLLPKQDATAVDSPLADITAGLREIMREAESFAGDAASQMTNIDTQGVREDLHSLLDEVTNAVPAEMLGRWVRHASGLGGDGKAIAAEVSAALKKVSESIREAKGELAETDFSKAIRSSTGAARQSTNEAVPGEKAPAPTQEATPTEPASKGGKASKSHHFSGRRHQDLVPLFQPLTVREGESFRNAVVVLNDATVDGTVTGNLVVIGGHVVLNGEVEGNLVAPLSSVELGPKAVVGGNVVAIGGGLHVADGAEIRGDRVTVPVPFDLGGATRLGAGLRTSLKELVFKARPLSLRVRWVWAIWILLVAVHLLLALLFHRAVQAGALVLRLRPASAFLMGLAALPFLLLLIVITAPTVVVPLVLLLALPFAILFGKTAVCRHIGGLLTQPAHGSLLMGLGAVVVGMLLLTLVYLIPFFGFLAWALFTLWGLGAAVLALWTAFCNEQPTPLASPPVVGSSVGRSATPSTTLAVAAAPPPGIPAPDPLTSPPTAPSRAVTAGFLRRLGACCIDVTLLGALTGWLLPFGFLFWIAYFAAMWVWRGTTLGGIVFGLRVVRLDGRPIDVPTALVRSLAAILSVATCFLGYMWAAWDPDCQTWHDKLAGTAVVQTSEAQSLV